jgi:hypothetical protein
MPLDAERRRARARLAANTRHHPDKPELSASEAFEFRREDVRRIVASWPPLTSEQKSELAILLLNPAGDDHGAA